MYPKIFLAIDNCFAVKRWTAPDEWARIIADLDVKYIEASADTELDPLYMGKTYLNWWKEKVKDTQKAYDVSVANLFSGHGTYSTLGLAHADADVRNHMIEEWFKPMIETAAELGAGIGFYAHAFPVEGLQTQEKYDEYCKILMDGLFLLNTYAQKVGCKYLALEQMYSPNQIPWTIQGTKQLIQKLSDSSGYPFYFTEDVGHHLTRYVMPTVEDIQQGVKNHQLGIWLGNDEAYERYEFALRKGSITEAECSEIMASMQKTPYMFAQTQDGDCYSWLKMLGCYAPIIHLQQTDGTTSAHKPFTEQNNAWGKVCAKKVLRTLKESYDAPVDMTMPKRCEEIYLTLEVFSGTAQTSREIIQDYQETVAYWRQYIPADGISLDVLVKHLDETAV